MSMKACVMSKGVCLKPIVYMEKPMLGWLINGRSQIMMAMCEFEFIE